ncbi:hypothetical protein ACA910_008428 [Epithemia clementina (nom. ined.)]
MLRRRFEAQEDTVSLVSRKSGKNFAASRSVDGSILKLSRSPIRRRPLFRRTQSNVGPTANACSYSVCYDPHDEDSVRMFSALTIVNQSKSHKRSFGRLSSAVSLLRQLDYERVPNGITLRIFTPLDRTNYYQDSTAGGSVLSGRSSRREASQERQDIDYTVALPSTFTNSRTGHPGTPSTKKSGTAGPTPQQEKLARTTSMESSSSSTLTTLYQKLEREEANAAGDSNDKSKQRSLRRGSFKIPKGSNWRKAGKGIAFRSNIGRVGDKKESNRGHRNSRDSRSEQQQEPVIVRDKVERHHGTDNSSEIVDASVAIGASMTNSTLSSTEDDRDGFGNSSIIANINDLPTENSRRSSTAKKRKQHGKNKRPSAVLLLFLAACTAAEDTGALILDAADYMDKTILPRCTKYGV